MHSELVTLLGMKLRAVNVAMLDRGIKGNIVGRLEDGIFFLFYMDTIGMDKIEP